MTKVLNFIRSETVSLTAFILAVLNLGQLFGLWTLTPDQIAGVNVALAAFFALFVRQAVTPTVKLKA